MRIAAIMMQSTLCDAIALASAAGTCSGSGGLAGVLGTVILAWSAVIRRKRSPPPSLLL